MRYDKDKAGSVVMIVETDRNVYKGRVRHTGQFIYVYTGKPGRPPRIPVGRIERIAIAAPEGHS